MATPTDSTTVLNPGVGGDTMDESAPSRADQTTRKRPRVHIAGGANENALIEPTVANESFGMPITNAVQSTQLDQVILLLSSIDGHLAALTGRLPFAN